MGTIKLRAWDKDARKMTTPDGDFSKHIRIGLDGTLYWEGRDMSRDFVITRFTGLTDKNGEDIYEGDIVRMSGDYKPGVYSVIWDDYRSAWWLKNIKADTRKLEMDDDYCQLLGNGWQNEHREVIGNIHELLEVAD